MEISQLLLLLCVWALSSLSLQSAEMIEHCPDRILDNEKRRTCPKKCQQDNDCGNKRQCLCDGPCGLSCVAPGRTCPWPLPSSEHFNVTLLSPSPSFSALLEVRCHPGYTMTNGLNATIRRCQGDRQWSGDDPRCTANHPRMLEIARYESSECVNRSFQMDRCEAVHYSSVLSSTYPPTHSFIYLPIRQHPSSCTPLCPLALHSASFKHRGRNAETEPESKLACPLPDHDLLLIHGSAAVGSTIQYQCAPGSVLVGSSENFCHKDQTWRYPQPVCQRVFCPPPQEVNHGYLVAVQKSEYNMGDTIYYLCKKNFLLDGPNQVTCQLDGTWSTVPSCRARCPIPAQRSRVIVGRVKSWPYDLTDGMVTHGENVTFFCKHPQKSCSFTATETCFDGLLPAPSCYLEPTWFQYKLYPHRLVSEINPCDPAGLDSTSE
ncbi:beta-2-glycoprotein 1-like isoform X1 [Ictalurus punctatus]|uniref:Beta-2-glycoprotein 1 n=1 Tax=Ictalurus punctatus TaxID=7998 RepID=A0A9F7RI74_ICTPU|nr:beta-2-glycoprotein 1-like isoform X1 [Ictalurus punctatus]